jgi:non-ribosomal peptide synthetase component E (peptide arylation enzyme)
MYGSKVQNRIYKITPEDVVTIFALPMVGPNFPGHFIAPRVGAKIAMLEHFEAEEALKLIEKEKVTIACVVPAMLSMMVRHPNLKDYDLSSLRYLESTGSSLPYQLAIEAEEKMGCPIIQIYGAADFGVVCIPNPEATREVRLVTVGKPYEGCEVKLIDDDGREVGEGEVGEIMARGPACASGYYKDAEATWQAWTKDGWFKLGDLGKFDKEGNLAIVGRKKEIIIRGGQNIYPIEIESMLITHPKVSDVAIIGMPDPVMIEKACAYVTLKSGQSFTFEEMVSFLKDKNVASYKFPERLEIIDRLPMVAEGQKVDKKLLRQAIAQKLEEEGKI